MHTCTWYRTIRISDWHWLNWAWANQFACSIKLIGFYSHSTRKFEFFLLFPWTDHHNIDSLSIGYDICHLNFDKFSVYDFDECCCWWCCLFFFVGFRYNIYHHRHQSQAVSFSLCSFPNALHYKSPFWWMFGTVCVSVRTVHSVHILGVDLLWNESIKIFWGFNKVVGFFLSFLFGPLLCVVCCGSLCLMKGRIKSSIFLGRMFGSSNAVEFVLNGTHLANTSQQKS